jgi:dinuclear metal center YbgI/SA1388 family protein
MGPEMWTKDLVDYTGRLLEVSRFEDYCPNGLQVEGRAKTRRLCTGVTASLAVLEQAIAHGADAVLVHHGYFWKNEPAPITGQKKARLALLLKNEVNLLAYHLPLDAHPHLGNNAELARRLGVTVAGWFGDQAIAAWGEPEQPLTLGGLAALIEDRLARPPLLIGDPTRPIHRLAWCTGGAQDFLTDAVALGVDAFLTGEVSERTFHLSRESGVAFLAAGHHATERYGVQALGNHLAETFGIEHAFIDEENPV